MKVVVSCSPNVKHQQLYHTLYNNENNTIIASFPRFAKKLLSALLVARQPHENAQSLGSQTSGVVTKE